MQNSIDELTRMIAKQSDQLDQVLTMLRRREAELRSSKSEIRRLRRLLGLPPDPDSDLLEIPPSDTVDDHDDPEGGSVCAPLGTTACTTFDIDESELCPDDETLLYVEPKKRKPRESGGRRPPPEHLPAETEHHAVCACGVCGVGSSSETCSRPLSTPLFRPSSVAD